MNEWTFDKSSPVYIQLRDALKIKLLSGEYPPNSLLPSIRQLSQNAGVNTATTARAYILLANERLVVKQRRGYMVTADTEYIRSIRDQSIQQILFEFIKAMTSLGYSKKEIQDLMEA